MDQPSLFPSMAVCPMCNGSKRIPAGDSKYKVMTYGYDHLTDTFICSNCGGQTMGGIAKGEVPINPKTGEGCMHSCPGEKIGNCLYKHVCVHGCGFSYVIDSGD